MEELTIAEAYSSLITDDSTWTYPYMKEICILCLEYLMLDGLPDATKSIKIPNKILEICKEEI